jgi:hypothetical protein
MMRLHPGAEYSSSGNLRLLPSLSDDSNNFYVTPHRTRAEIIISQALLCLGLLTFCIPLSPAQFFLYLSLKLMSMPLIWAEVLTLPLP